MLKHYGYIEEYRSYRKPQCDLMHMTLHFYRKRLGMSPSELHHKGRWCPRIFKRTRSPLMSGFPCANGALTRSGCSGMPAIGRNPIQRRHQPRHQRQRDPQVATTLPRSFTSGVASFRSVGSYAQTAGGSIGDHRAVALRAIDQLLPHRLTSSLPRTLMSDG